MHPGAADVLDGKLEALPALQLRRQAVDDADHHHVAAFVGKRQLISQAQVSAQGGIEEAGNDGRDHRGRHAERAQPWSARVPLPPGDQPAQSARSGQRRTDSNGRQRGLLLQQERAHHERRQDERRHAAISRAAPPAAAARRRR
jgi:hypothetical protein